MIFTSILEELASLFLRNIESAIVDAVPRPPVPVKMQTK